MKDMYISSYVSIIAVITVEFMGIEDWTNFQIHLNKAPIFVVVVMFPVWWQCCALSHLFDGLEKKSTLGFWYHLGWRGDGQDLLGWVVVFIPVRQEPGSGPQAHWRLHSGGSCCLKPTLSGSSPTFTTFWSHKWWFWERLRWDPFQKEEGRRAIEPNGTQENHFMRLK